jgi:hypothetical protein
MVLLILPANAIDKQPKEQVMYFGYRRWIKKAGSVPLCHGSRIGSPSTALL